jgi:hypothetical protein
MARAVKCCANAKMMCSRRTAGCGRHQVGNGPAQADQADRFLPDGLTLDQYEQGLTRNALRYRLTQMGLES